MVIGDVRHDWTRSQFLWSLLLGFDRYFRHGLNRFRLRRCLRNCRALLCHLCNLIGHERWIAVPRNLVIKPILWCATTNVVIWWIERHHWVIGILHTIRYGLGHAVRVPRLLWHLVVLEWGIVCLLLCIGAAIAFALSTESPFSRFSVIRILHCGFSSSFQILFLFFRNSLSSFGLFIWNSAVRSSTQGKSFSARGTANE